MLASSWQHEPACVAGAVHTRTAARSPNPGPNRHLPLQTRSATCYDGAGTELADSECGGSDSKPATVQACDDCSAQAPSAAVAAPAGGSTEGGSGLTGTTLVIVAVAAGAAVAAAVAAGGFLLFRRSQRKRVEDRSMGSQLPPPPPMPAGKWSCDEGVAADAIDVIPLPKHLRPIATGRSSRRSPRLQQPGGGAPQGTRHLAAAAGDVAAAAMQQQVAGAAAYAQSAAQLQQYAPEYHVVHMPSPRLTGGRAVLLCWLAGLAGLACWQEQLRAAEGGLGSAGGGGRSSWLTAS